MSGPLGMIEGALQFSGEVARAGSIYFQENPIAGLHLEQLMKQERAYLAHDRPSGEVASLCPGSDKVAICIFPLPIHQLTTPTLLAT